VRSLNLSQNNLSILPVTFKKLKNIEVIDLSSNQFQYIPDCIEDLKFLSYFCIANIPENEKIAKSESEHSTQVLNEFINLLHDFLNTSDFKKLLRKNLKEYNGLFQIEQTKLHTLCDLSVSIIENKFPSELEDGKEKIDLMGMIAKIKEMYFTSLKEQVFPFNLSWRIIKRILNIHFMGKINLRKTITHIFIILLNNILYHQDFTFNPVLPDIRGELDINYENHLN